MKIISNQLEIKLGQFTQEELDPILRKIKNKRAAVFAEILQKYGRPGNSMIYCSEAVMLYITKNTIDRGTKGCIPPFPKKGDLGLAKNYRGITLTSIAAKIYNALLHNRIEPKIEKIHRKNQNGFRRNRSMTSEILTICQILDVRAKALRQQYHLLTSPIFLTPYREERWGKYPKKPSQP